MSLFTSAVVEKLAWLEYQPEIVKSLVEVLIILPVTLFLSLIELIVYRKLYSYFLRSHRIWDDIFVDAVHKPIQLIIITTGIAFSLNVFDSYFPVISITKYTDFLQQLIVVIAVLWAMHRFTKDLEDNILNSRREHVMDKASAFALNRIFRIVMFFIALIAVMQVIGVPLSGVLTLGGVGALAVSFAAKDTLANFFGGMMLYFEKPFSVGDFISIDGKSISGTVENIGFRSTRLTATDTKPIYVPNSFFTTSAVTNTTRMTHRYVNMSLTLRYQDVAKLPKISEDLVAYLDQHETVDSDKKIRAYFSAFSDSSVDINIVFFSTLTSSNDYAPVQQEMLMAYAGIVAKHGADFAFPTQTLEASDSIQALFKKPGE